MVSWVFTTILLNYTPTCDEDKHVYKSTYIYPPRLDMTPEEYDRWCLDKINNWQEDTEMAQNYYFDKIIVENTKSHNVKIKEVRNGE